MTMLLYDSQVSGNCYKVRLLLAQLRVEYERREVDVIDRSNREEVLRLNPALRVPTLVLDDGRALPESNAIIWYLADGTEYLPDDAFDRAKVLQWLFFEQYSHEPYIAVPRFLLTIADTPPSQSDLDAKHAGGYAALGAMERRLSGNPFLVGERSRSPTWPSTPTHTSRTRPASTSAGIPQWSPGWRGSPRSHATSRSPRRPREPSSGTALSFRRLGRAKRGDGSAPLLADLGGGDSARAWAVIRGFGLESGGLLRR